MNPIKKNLLFLSFFVFYNSIGMAQIQKPGVYIKELPTLPLSVSEVATAIPAFIGYTATAKKQASDDLRFVPHKISSLKDYEEAYGLSAATPGFVLYPSLQLFFNNGGSTCYIVSIGDYANPPQKADFIKGLESISNKDEPTLLVFPDAVNLPGNDLCDVQKLALKQAADLGDRFCILDLKFAATKEAHAAVVNEFRNNIGTNYLSFGAAYTPYLKSATGSQPMLPPSAAVAGQYCSIDKTRGVWKAPANVSINSVTDLAYAITNNEQDGLNVDAAAGKSINAIRRFTGKGILIWGARTLAGNDNEWRYVPVRRFFMSVEESVKKACMPFVFEPNDANTWVKIRVMIENYLTLKWREGALAGTKPEQAYYVKVGLGQTMTALDILEGRLIVEIGLAAVRPAEFILLRFSLKVVKN